MKPPRLARWRTVLAWAAVAIFTATVVAPVLHVALTSERRPQIETLPPVPAGAYRIFVADWGYHTAIVVQQPAGWRLGPPGEEDAPFLEYAWGDAGFYRDSDFRPQSLYAALFLPTGSVMYLDGRPDPPHLGGARAVFTRTVDAPTLRAVLTDLERSFRHAPDGGRASAHPPVRGYPGRFYEAHGSYLWPRDCNWWTVARLGSVRLADDPGGVILTAQVPGRLRGFAPIPPIG